MVKEYKNPGLTVDIAVFSLIENKLKMLLIKRKNPPFQDKWAIPGGFVEYDEEIETAAHRELEEETGVKELHLEQIHTFGKVGRDPRCRTISVVYLALIDHTKAKVKADSDAKEAEWFSLNNLPKLAFDHEVLINFALKTLRQKLENSPIVAPIMPAEFTTTELQKVYEIILDKSFDSQNFETVIMQTKLLEPIGTTKYKFRKKAEFISKFN